LRFIRLSTLKVLGWLHGEFLPEEPEVLNIAGIFGTDIYEVLDLPKPEPQLLKIYKSFAHLTGENRGKIAHALWEAQIEMSEKGVTATSEEAKSILSEAFKKWGIDKPNR